VNLGDMKVHIPKPETPKINLKVAELSVAQIKAMSNEEIKAILTGEKAVNGMLSVATQNALTIELSERAIEKASKPHWSTTYNFWTTVVAALASCAAVYLAIYPRPSQSFPEVQKSVLPAQSVQHPVSSSRKLLLHKQLQLSTTRKKKP